MKESNKTVDVAAFFRYLWKKFIILIIAGIAGCALLGAYNIKKQKGDNNKSSHDRLKEVIQQNHDAFFNNTNNYSDAFLPKGVYNSSALISVDFNYADIDGLEKTSFQEVNKRFENDALNIIKDGGFLNGVIANAKLREYADMEDITTDELQWLINKNFQGAHVMNIVVSDTDPQRAKMICDEIIKGLVVRLEKLDFVDKAEIISEGTLPSGSKLANNSGNSIDKKTVLKYGIAGGFLAGVMAVIILLLVFTFSNAIYTKKDLAFAGVDYVAEIKKDGNVSRAAHSIMMFEDVETILLVAVDDKVDAKKIAEDINKELKEAKSDKTVVGVENFYNGTEAFDVVKKCDAVLFLVKSGKTKIALLDEARVTLERSAKSLGAVVI